MLSEEDNQAANLLDSQNQSLMLSRRAFRLPRSYSCPPTFRQFALKKNPSTLTKKELHAIVIKDSRIRSENLEQYGFGGYMHLKFGNVFGPDNQYLVLRKIGWGHFSTVWLCRHRSKNHAYYAIKVIKSAEKYKEQFLDEIDILKHVNNQDHESTGFNRVITFYSTFNEWSVNGIHPCIVFEVLGPSLLDLVRASDFHGIYQPTAKNIMKQVLEGMKFLHEVCSIIHRDLKLENILIVPTQSNLEEIITYLDRFVALKEQMPKSYVSAPNWQDYVEVYGDPEDSSPAVSCSQANTPRSLHMEQTKTSKSANKTHPLFFTNPNIRVKIADLGNACLENQCVSSWIQTKQYRALEVLIDSGYSFPVDMWSIGCIAFEISTGEYLFNPRNLANLSYIEHHLGLIWETLGEIPKKIALSGRNSTDYFDEAGRLIKVDFGRRKLWQVEDILVDRYKWQHEDALLFSHFVRSLVNPDPNLRATASSALYHRWIKEIGI